MSCRLLILIIMSIGVGISARCQTFKDSVQIHFRQSKINLDSTYMDNAQILNHMKESLSKIKNENSENVLTNVTVVGGASPEGSVKFNEWLSQKRASRIFDYINSQINLPDSLTTFTLLGRDWKGLREMVVNDPDVPFKNDVITTIDGIIIKCKQEERESDGNIATIKNLHQGIPYRYLYKNLFPSLRESKIVMTFSNFALPYFDENITNLGIYTIPTLEMPNFITGIEPSHDKPFYMALKTNMLLDVLAVPEGSIEFYLGKNYSIVGNWMYGWWDNDHAHKYWRMYGGDLAFRWWFGKKAHEKPLTGHHLGLYAGLVTYDFEWGGRGYMGGLPGRTLWDRCNHHFGVEYGYSLPIARRFNIDFTLGLGYLGGKYIEYEPIDNCYVYEVTKKRHWYGPTKLEVSLVWLIGHGNYNTKKGGKI